MIIEMDFSGGAGCSYCRFAITGCTWEGKKMGKKMKVCTHPTVEEAFAGQPWEARAVGNERPRWCPRYKGGDKE